MASLAVILIVSVLFVNVDASLPSPEFTLSGPDPSSIFYLWKRMIFHYASTFTAVLAIANYQLGLLHLVTTDDEWNSHPSNQLAADANGIAQFRPKPTNVMPTIPAALNQLNQRAHETNMKNYAAIITAITEFTAWTADSAGLIKQHLTADNLFGSSAVSLSNIMTTAANWYGRLTARGLETIMEQLNAPAAPLASIVDLASIQRRLFTQLQNSGQPISQGAMLACLVKSIANIPEFSYAIGRYRETQPHLHLQTYDGAVDYIRLHVANQTAIPATSTGYIAAVAPPVIAVRHTPAPHLAPRSAAARAPTPGPPRSSQRPAMHYCFCHGENGSHASADCAEMHRPEHAGLYSDAQHRATTPGSDPRANKSTPASRAAEGKSYGRNRRP